MASRSESTAAGSAPTAPTHCRRRKERINRCVFKPELVDLAAEEGDGEGGLDGGEGAQAPPVPPAALRALHEDSSFPPPQIRPRCGACGVSAPESRFSLDKGFIVFFCLSSSLWLN